MNIFIFPVVEGDGTAFGPCRLQQLHRGCTITEGGGDTCPGVRMIAEQVGTRECR
jgi:hypothetical protein